ncbi:MAG: DNA polymerase IV [Candidatus Aureabacteria bacterium]|nr:DNA polymerase IV [Candidatus Auribacterota bacterium]
MNKIILHIDMDAFFASVEQSANPALKGKPMAVIGTGKRTVVTTSSYEARKYGVTTGMTVADAKKCCPKIIFRTGDHLKYTYTSAKINKIFLKYTPYVEMYSVDESFLDITFCHQNGIIQTAKSIKKDIYMQTGLTCSIGMSHNKLLAKLVSDINKPNGLFYLKKQNVPEFLEKLPVNKLCGIGRKTTEYLLSLGIKTCGELGRFSVKELKKHFGVNGEKLSLMGQGEDSSPIVPIGAEEDAKSIGHSSTFDNDVFDQAILERYLFKLCDMVSRRMRRNKSWGDVISVTVRYMDFTTLTRQIKLKDIIQHTHSIFYYAKYILDEKCALSYPVRLLGVSISGLRKNDYQEDLFNNIEKRNRLFNAIDSVSEIFGNDSTNWGILLDRPLKTSTVISPSWRPHGVRSY